MVRKNNVSRYIREHKEEFKQHILDKKTEIQLGKIYGCSNATIIAMKRELKLQTRDLLPNDKNNRRQNITHCKVCNKPSNKKTCYLCVHKRTNIAMKEILIEMAGSKCEKCGYSDCLAAMDFHHIDPNEKEINLGQSDRCKNLAKKIEELKKCKLLCCRCHRELHYEKTKEFAAKNRHTIDQTKKNLRNKMGKRGGGPRHIE